MNGVFLKKKKNWSPVQNKLRNKQKRIEPRTDAAKQDYKQITFLRQKQQNQYFSFFELQIEECRAQ